MKKNQLVSLGLLFALASCGSGEIGTNLQIVTPVGAPAFAFYNYAKADNFQTNGVPKNIVAMMTEQSDKDVVVIDTVTGLKAIQNGSPYLLAANITFGNFYIASTGHDDNGMMDENDKIILFGEGQTPDKIFHFLYGNEFDSQIEFVGNVSDAQSCLVTGKNLATSSEVDYVFIAQPALFGALKSNENATVYANMQEEYAKKTNGLEMIQASVFVKKNDNKKYHEKLKDFLDDLEDEIEELLENPSKLDETIGQLDENLAMSIYGAKYQVVKQVIAQNNGLGLGYKDALENKDNIDAFIALFGMEKTNEEIYF